jgi:hypothetical protein
MGNLVSITYNSKGNELIFTGSKGEFSVPVSGLR